MGSLLALSTWVSFCFMHEGVFGFFLAGYVLALSLWRSFGFVMVGSFTFFKM